MTAKAGSRLPTPLVYLRTMAVFIVVWALVARWTGNVALLPSPLAVIDALVDLVRDMELFVHAGKVVVRIGVQLPLELGLGLHLDRLIGGV